MFSKNLESITAGDITALIEGGETERKTREYKRQLPGTTPPDKDKLRANATSLANTAGGDLFFGIDEVDEAPVLTGIGDMSEDEAVRHILGTLQYNIEPKLPPPPHKLVAMPGGERVLIVRIARSWRGPHFVKNNDNYRMYGRHSKGRFPMDASEMRQAIMASEELPQRIRRWRQERLDTIVGQETPAPIADGPLLVLHVVPLESFDDEYRISATELNKHEHSSNLWPLAGGTMNQRINIDGVVRWVPPNQGYCQAYRSGRIESVLCGPWTYESHIRSVAYERDVLAGASRQVTLLRTLGLRGPISIQLTLARARGLTMGVDPDWMLKPHPIDRRRVLTSELLVEEGPVDWFATLKPAFDAIWNACGLERSYNYDENGNWIGGQVQGLPAP